MRGASPSRSRSSGLPARRATERASLAASTIGSSASSTRSSRDCFRPRTRRRSRIASKRAICSGENRSALRVKRTQGRARPAAAAPPARPRCLGLAIAPRCGRVPGELAREASTDGSWLPARHGWISSLRPTSATPSSAWRSERSRAPWSRRWPPWPRTGGARADSRGNHCLTTMRSPARNRGPRIRSRQGGVVGCSGHGAPRQHPADPRFNSAKSMGRRGTTWKRVSGAPSTAGPRARRGPGRAASSCPDTGPACGRRGGSPARRG
jgi:hypothetical protein